MSVVELNRIDLMLFNWLIGVFVQRAIVCVERMTSFGDIFTKYH